jgi:hypothetical protein
MDLKIPCPHCSGKGELTGNDAKRETIAIMLKRTGVSQKELREATGCSSSAMMRYSTGRGPIPDDLFESMVNWLT